MGNLSKWGGAAAVYLAAAQGIGTYVFRVRLDYPHMSMAQRVEFMNERLNLFWYSGLLLHVAFGLALVVLIAALHGRMGPKSPSLVTVASALGLIWAGLQIASGVVEHAGIVTAVVALMINTAQAPWVWAQTEALAHGLSGENGQIVGGVMTAVFGVVGMQTLGLSRLLGGFAILTGLAGIASVVWTPSFDLIAAFAFAQCLWFIGLAWTLLRAEPQA